VGHLESLGQTNVIELWFVVLIGKVTKPKHRNENNIKDDDRMM
jgi:hypothetical protein